MLIEFGEAMERAALRAGDPVAALRRAWVQPRGARVCVLSVGKAAVEMAAAGKELLGARMVRALVVGPEGSSGAARGVGMHEGGVVEVMEGDHPYPTGRSLAAGIAVERFVRGVGMGEELVVMLSGGGSALACLPREGLGVEDVAEMTRVVQKAGGDIGRLNVLRRHCERIKGGGLARVCGAGAVRVYVLSDVLGDDLATVASGPFAADVTTRGDAARVLEELGLEGRLGRVWGWLRGGGEETMKRVDPRVEHVVIASSGMVGEAVAAEVGAWARVGGVELGVTGEAAEVGRGLARRWKGDRGKAWVIAGEYTVEVGEGEGVGGPTQEMALGAVVELEGEEEWAMWAYSTDGRDGPSEACGVLADAGMVRGRGEAARAALAAHDSGGYWMACGGALARRVTGTNLNHVAVLVGLAGRKS